MKPFSKPLALSLMLAAGLAMTACSKQSVFGDSRPDPRDSRSEQDRFDRYDRDRFDRAPALALGGGAASRVMLTEANTLGQGFRTIGAIEVEIEAGGGFFSDPRGREDAEQRLREEAARIGADAVIGVRITEESGGLFGTDLIIADGVAVARQGGGVARQTFAPGAAQGLGVQAAPQVFVPTAPTKDQGPRNGAVYLGFFPSDMDAQAWANQLWQRNSDILAGTTSQIRPSGGGGGGQESHHLYAVGLTGVGAQQVCQALSRRSVQCSAQTF